MSLVRYIVIGLALGLVILWMGLSGNNRPVTTEYIVQQTSKEGGGRADDDTYAEELRTATKKYEVSEQRVTEMEDKLERMSSFIQRQQTQIELSTKQKIAELEAYLKDSENRLGRLSQAEIALRQELQKKLEGLKDGSITFEDIESRLLAEVEKRFSQKDSDEGKTAIERLKPEDEAKSLPRPEAIPALPNKPVSPATPTPKGSVSIRPYGVTTPSGKNSFGGAMNDLFSMTTPKVQDRKDTSNPFDFSVTNQEEIKPIPVYTIPDTSTLVVNSLMTPLIGKVPDTKNNVNDPYRFKFITGSDNLATNGLRIPGIANIVWTGYAVGVRDQSCVRAYVDTVTYTFEDGRIHTFTKGKNSGGGGSGGESNTGNQTLGYLTDPWGKPCIGGQYFSNSTRYMRDRTISAFIGAVANASAESEVEMVENEQGDLRGFVTGRTGQYVVGKGLAGSAKELSDYIKDRATGAFDVIYVDSGIHVQMFIETEIPIDYNPNGRKIAYDYSPEGSAITTEFD